MTEHVAWHCAQLSSQFYCNEIMQKIWEEQRAFLMLGRVQFSLLEKAHKAILKEYEIFCCLTMLGLRTFGIFERNNGKK